MDGKSLHGERVGVEFARRPGEAGRREGRRTFGYRSQRRFSPERRPFRGGPPVRTNYRLIVENLSSAVSWQVRWDGVSDSDVFAVRLCVYIHSPMATRLLRI